MTTKEQLYLLSDKHIKISKGIICGILNLLQMFIPATLAKRLVCLLLIIAGASNDFIIDWTGVCERNVRQWRRQIYAGQTDGLLEIKKNPGRKSNFDGIESLVIDEIERGNYHTLQEIADMVGEKFGIKVSKYAVRRLLKKTPSKSSNQDRSQQRQTLKSNSTSMSPQ